MIDVERVSIASLAREFAENDHRLRQACQRIGVEIDADDFVEIDPKTRGKLKGTAAAIYAEHLATKKG